MYCTAQLLVTTLNLKNIKVNSKQATASRQQQAGNSKQATASRYDVDFSVPNMTL